MALPAGPELTSFSLRLSMGSRITAWTRPWIKCTYKFHFDLLDLDRYCSMHRMTLKQYLFKACPIRVISITICNHFGKIPEFVK